MSNRPTIPIIAAGNSASLSIGPFSKRVDQITDSPFTPEDARHCEMWIGMQN